MLSSPPTWTRGTRREVLPNGLTLLVQRDDSAPVVAVVTHVKAGFFDEPDRWTGVSHVLEHMFFKGTAHRGVGAIARETKSAGGYLNASTTYDHTSYFAVLPAASLPAALNIQADALRNSVVDAGELARELQVIIQEAKRKLDTPSSLAYETLHEVMFDRHRMRRWRIGHEAQLAGFTRDDVFGYYRSRYVPSRTIVSIVGAVDPDEALALARATYGDWPAGDGAVDPSPEEPERREVRARTLRGDITRAELALGWRTVPPLHPDSTALDVAAAVLTSGRGSWLYRSLREPGLVTWVAANNYAPTELGVFSIGAELEAEQGAGGRRGHRGGHSQTHPARTVTPRSWSGLGLCSAPVGLGVSSPWRAAPARLRRRKRSRTSVCWTGNTRSCCPSPRSRCEPRPPGTCIPMPCRRWPTCPTARDADLTTDGLARAFAVTALEASPAVGAKHSGSRPAASRRGKGRRRRTRRAAFGSGPAGPAQTGRAARHLRRLRSEAGVRSARAGGTRRAARACRRARRRRPRLRRSGLCLRAAGRLAYSQPGERLARLRHLRAERPPR